MLFRSLDDGRIAVLSMKTGRYHTVVEGGMNARYAPSGHLVYARHGQLLAAPFDLGRLEMSGAPLAVAEGVIENPDNGAASYAFSRDGTLIFAPGGAVTTAGTLMWVDRHGAARPLPAPPGPYSWPRISPDGQRLAVHIAALYDDIWVYEFGRGTFTRFTFATDTHNGWPVWTPDNKRLVFGSIGVRGRMELLWKPAQGSGQEERLSSGEDQIFPTSCSPDGKVLAFTKLDPGTGPDVWMLPLEGERKPRPFLHTSFSERQAQFSPDGRWLAYTSNESGRPEIYVTPYLSAEGKSQVSSAGGDGAVWARNGHELFFREGDRMMAVDVDTRAGFKAGKPHMLFEGRSAGFSFADYDVAPDGQRFLMIQSPQTSVRQLHVVFNWFEELQRRVPTGK